MIYFDNAATTKDKPREVIDAVAYALQHFGNSSRGIYSESLSADRLIYRARKKLADFFGVGNARQIVFTKNATESLNIAIHGLFRSGDHIITSVAEHNSVLRPLNYLKREGVNVDYLDVNEDGGLEWSKLQAHILPDTKAVILTHASNVTGNINPIETIGQICRRNRLLFIVDASQTAGAFEIDMERANIDVLCCTGHKSMLGPQGVGVLCVKKGVYIRPWLSGGTGTHSYEELQVDAMPTRLEAGTLNSHGISGLYAGLEYLESNLIRYEEGFSSKIPTASLGDPNLYAAFREKSQTVQALTLKSVGLAKYFHERIQKIDGIRVYGDFTDWYRAPIVSLNIGNLDSSFVSGVLSERHRIATRPGAHCAPLLHKAMGTVQQGMVRFSFSHKNTYEEIDIAVEALHSIAKHEVK